MLPSTLASKYIEKMAQKFTDTSTEFFAWCFTKTRPDKDTWQGLTKSVFDILQRLLSPYYKKNVSIHIYFDLRV